LYHPFAWSDWLLPSAHALGEPSESEGGPGSTYVGHRSRIGTSVSEAGLKDYLVFLGIYANPETQGDQPAKISAPR
jgi:hypothetical protein